MPVTYPFTTPWSGPIFPGLCAEILAGRRASPSRCDVEKKVGVIWCFACVLCIDAQRAKQTDDETR